MQVTLLGLLNSLLCSDTADGTRLRCQEPGNIYLIEISGVARSAERQVCRRIFVSVVTLMTPVGSYRALCWGWRPAGGWPWRAGWSGRCSFWSRAEPDTRRGSGKCAWPLHQEESRGAEGSANSRSSSWSRNTHSQLPTQRICEGVRQKI